MKTLTINNNKIIQNDKFSSIDISIIFPCKNKKEYLFYLPLLRQIMLNSSYEYKDEQSYKKAFKEKMIIRQSMYNTKYNKNLYIEFALTVPNPLKIKDYDLEGAIKFFYNTIYNSNVINKEFNEQSFNREKEFLKQDILHGLKNVNTVAYNNFINIVDDIGIYKENIYNNMDLIDKANNKELYEIYEELILNNKPIITIYGNIDTNIKETIFKYFKSDDTISFDIEYSNYFKPFKEIKDITDNSKYNQSVLYVAYKVNDMNEEDEQYITIIKDMLIYGSNDLLMKKLRKENDYIYHGKAWCFARSGLLVNEVYINNNSKEEVVKLIREIFESLKDKKFLQECINNEKEELYYSTIRAKDSRLKPLDDYIVNILKIGYSMEERLHFYETIDIDKLVNFVNRLKLDTIYFYRGEFNE